MLPVLRTNRVRSLWNDPFDAMRRELDQVFNRNWTEAGSADLMGVYPVDIREDDDHVYIEAELPGFSKNEVDVTLEGGIITLTAQRKSEEEKKGTAHLSERRFTRVQRSFTLPTSVDESKVDASLHNGVLNIKLTKREEVKPRKIEVK